jgi:DNA-damage-inducible protein J
MKTSDSHSKPLQSTAAHDAWFRAKVQEALDDPRPCIPHDQVQAYFAKRCSAAMRKARP